MDVKVPFKWILSSEKLEELNRVSHLKKYLCSVMNEKWYVGLKISRRRTAIIIKRIRNRGLKSARIKLDSHIAIFRAAETLTKLDSKRMKISANKRNAYSCLKPVVKTEFNLRNKLIVKGNFKFRITSREDSAISENSASTSLPIVAPTCNTLKIVSDSSVKKQKATINKCISTLKEQKYMAFHVTELSKDLGTMFNNSTYSDVIITCQSQQFRAHKVILNARCPNLLLDSRLKKDPCEVDVITEITIDHLPVLTVSTLLLYIYSGKLELTLYLACDLIYVANMYNFIKLKDVCMEYVVNALNDENVLFIYSFSYPIDEILKGHALKYIVEQFSSISNSLLWKQLKEARPDISVDILSELVKDKVPPMIDLSLE